MYRGDPCNALATCPVRYCMAIRYSKGKFAGRKSGTLTPIRYSKVRLYLGDLKLQDRCLTYCLSGTYVRRSPRDYLYPSLVFHIGLYMPIDSALEFQNVRKVHRAVISKLLFQFSLYSYPSVVVPTLLYTYSVALPPRL